MTYTKTVWADEVLDGVERFEVLDNAGAAVDDLAELAQCQIKLKTAITTAGTAVDATALNNIEEGIEDLATGAARSVKGVAGGAAGDVADIAAGTDGHVLRRSGTDIGFGTVVAAGLASDAVETAKIKDLNVTADKLAAAAVIASKINIPLCEAERETDWNTTTTLAAVTFETVDEEVDDMWDSGAATRITIKTAGWYRIGFFVQIASGGTAGDYRLALVGRNGGTTGTDMIVSQACPSFAAAAGVTLSGGIDYEFAENDYIQLKTQAAGTINTLRARLSCTFVRP